MKILITNDDGINSPGIRAVLDTLRDEAECLVVAPAKQRSAMGHSITLYGHISVEEVDLDGLRGYAVRGTPADCVKFAVSGLRQKKPFDLLISGINLGLNTGVSVYYSGTVSAAREGLINGIPAIAISQGKEQNRDFSYATGLLRDFLHGYRHQHLPKDTFLNVNIPPIPFSKIKGVRVTKQAHSRFVEWFESHSTKNANGKKSYLLYGDMEVINPDGTSDEEALKEGFASITPLDLDITHYGRISEIRKWMKKKSRASRTSRTAGKIQKKK